MSFTRSWSWIRIKIMQLFSTQTLIKINKTFPFIFLQNHVLVVVDNHE
jgi:hypothetical protein